MADISISRADKWRRAGRTAIQALIAFSVIGPFIPAVIEQFTHDLPASDESQAIGAFLITAGIVLAAVAALISRIMLIPAVNDALTKLGLGATSTVVEPEDQSEATDGSEHVENEAEDIDPYAAVNEAISGGK